MAPECALLARNCPGERWCLTHDISGCPDYRAPVKVCLDCGDPHTEAMAICSACLQIELRNDYRADGWDYVAPAALRRDF